MGGEEQTAVPRRTGGLESVLALQSHTFFVPRRTGGLEKQQ